ncbi:MAG: hypothetical protein N2512_11145 [Armatimonadetes bacterium]|nr:hypothetical protein [Armatimonadota bacterium]
MRPFPAVKVLYSALRGAACRALAVVILSAPLLALSRGAAWAEEVRLPVVADTSLQAHEAELELNSGGSTVIRIKAWQHFMLLKFDLSAIGDWRVDRARLRLHLARPDHMLWRVGLSTVTADWAEGTGRSDKVDGGCTFLRAVAPDTFWAGPDSDFTDVAFGNGGSFVRYATPRELADGWLEIDVDPLLVAAMLQGGSFGLCISDEKGQTLYNNDVHSREQSQYAPYLLVEGEPDTGGAIKLPEHTLLVAARLEDLRAEEYPQAADFDHGAAHITFTAPDPIAVNYQLTVRGPDGTVSMPRWMLPPPTEPGRPCEIIVRGRPATRYSATLVALPAWGVRGSVSNFEFRTSPSLQRPEPLEVPPTDMPPAGEVRGQRLAVRAFPGEVKINPATGESLEGVSPARAVVLHAVRNEVVSFQFVVGADHLPVQATVRAESLRGENDREIPTSALRWFRVWSVKDGEAWWGEYAVPIADSFDLPWQENAVPGQKWQTLLCDLYVPRDCAPGVYQGEIRVQGPGETLMVPVSLRVHDWLMPDECTFEVDFNCYGPVCPADNWADYIAKERAYYAAAHEHRTTLNPLPYTHGGHVYDGFAPRVSGAGAATRVTDWATYDEHYGPYLDGSAFTGYRAGVPITHMYLPLHENWPAPIAAHYHVTIQESRYPEMIFAHARLAPPIEEAFDQDFKAAFVSVARQFAQHFAERGWTRTDLQCYLNNKHYYKDPNQGGRGTSWWCLDEPTCTDDFLALRFFGQLFAEAKADAGPARLIFRGDISRPQWQRDFLDGLTDLECVSGAFWTYNRRCLDMQRRWGVKFWHYGTANPVRESNLSALSWALRAYCEGADGILPWNVIGGEDALTQPIDTALLISGQRFGINGPIVSLRVKAFRRAQQDVELLAAVARKHGWNRLQAAEAIRPLVHLKGRTIAVHAEDAGRLAWEQIRQEDFHRLRLALYHALVQ